MRMIQRQTRAGLGPRDAARSMSAHSSSGRSSPNRTDPAATSTTIPPSYPRVSAYQTIPFRRPALPPIAGRSIFARRKRSTIRTPLRRPRHDQHALSVHILAAHTALAHGGRHPHHVLRRRRDGLDRGGKVSALDHPSQNARRGSSWCWRSFAWACVCAPVLRRCPPIYPNP